MKYIIKDFIYISPKRYVHTLYHVIQNVLLLPKLQIIILRLNICIHKIKVNLDSKDLSGWEIFKLRQHLKKYTFKWIVSDNLFNLKYNIYLVNLIKLIILIKLVEISCLFKSIGIIIP